MIARAPRVVRRYAGARLYDAAAGRYVSTAELREWRARGLAFIVVDSETSADVTALVLA